jgi:hypothetical protein
MEIAPTRFDGTSVALTALGLDSTSMAAPVAKSMAAVKEQRLA